MWKLCIDDDQGNRTVVELTRKEYTIGRAPTNTVCLTERNISRRHGRLLREGDDWILEDLDSYNGCRVSGERIKGRHVWVPGETIVVGDYRLKVTDAAADAVLTPETNATMPAKRVSLVPGGDDRLIALSGPSPLREYPLLGAMLQVGRGEECDIRLDDTSVSRVHVTVCQLTDGVFQVKDEASSNGLRVNGREVSDAVLTPGDIIELGDVELLFVPKGHAFDPRAYRRRSLRPAADVLKRLRHNPKLAISAVAGALVFGIALVGLSSSGEEVATSEQTPAAKALDEAEALMKAGQIDVAHKTLEAIGQDSNLRQSVRFREIETRWAEDQFQRAQRAASANEERHILERVAQATGVDRARRKRASDLLSLLAASDLHPSDLPKATEDAGTMVASPTSPGAPRRRPEVIDLDEEPARPAGHDTTNGGNEPAEGE